MLSFKEKSRYKSQNEIEFITVNKFGKIKTLIVKILLSIFTYLASYELMSRIAQTIPNINDQTIIKNASFTIAVIAASIVAIYSGDLLTDTIIKRDRKYLLQLFNNESSRSPIKSVKEIASKIAGNNIPSVNYNQIIETVNEKIDVISSFLHNSQEKCLMIDSGWGTGKTSLLLMAINKSRNNSNRYIYESAFKYVDGTRGYIEDIIRVLNEILAELSIDSDKETDEIISNLAAEPSKTLIDIIKTANNRPSLTTELINKINIEYEKKKCKNTIILILDDIDRLQGKEIVETLSLLSILQELSFIKIIIVGDRDVINSMLKKYGIYKPNLFVNKYLPDYNTVSLDYDFNYVRDIAVSFFVDKNEKMGNSTDGVEPAIAAVFCRIISDKLKEENNNSNCKPLMWLSHITEEFNDYTEKAKTIMNATSYIDNYVSKNYKISGNEYCWIDNGKEYPKFENIIINLKHEKSQKRLKDGLTIDDYLKIIRPILINFTEDNFKQLDISLRGIFDTLSILNIEKMPNETTKQFTFIYNQLFDEKIGFIK